MELFEKISSTISAAGKDGLNKAKEWTDTAKIMIDIKEREGAIYRLYRELGRAYFEDHKDDAAPEYSQIIAINAALEEIEQLKSNKDEIRGVRRCSKCGRIISSQAKFCAECGAKCEVPVETVDGEVVDSAEAEGAQEAEVVEEAEKTFEEAGADVKAEEAESDETTGEKCNCCE